MILVLLLLFLALLGLNFYFGVREWWHPKDSAPLPVDVEYVRVENYFGKSFRTKMQEWLQTASPVETTKPCEPPMKSLLEKPNHERILILTGGLLSGDGHEALVYCEGDLQLSDHCSLHREVYCRGNLNSGTGVQFQALAADGEIILGPENDVSRWVDAHRKILLGRGTVIHSRVSSSESIELEEQVAAQSLYASVVFTTGYRPCEPADIAAQMEDSIEETPDGVGQHASPFPEDCSVSQLAADTWLVRGDLHLPEGKRVATNIIVRGALTTGPDCEFWGDVKADRAELGLRNRVHGNLVSGGGIAIGESGWVGKSIAAETDILLHSGVRVGTPAILAAVSAGKEVKMEADVAVYGKVTGGQAVKSVGKIDADCDVKPRAKKRWFAVTVLLALVICQLRMPVFAQAERQLPFTQPQENSSARAANPSDPALGDPTGNYRFRLEAGGFDNAVSNRFGQWWGGLISLSYKPSNRVTTSASLISQTRPAGTEQLVTLDTVIDWSKWFYTQIGVSGGGADDPAAFFPRYRYDINGFFKVPGKPALVLDGGYTRLQFGAPVGGRISRMGAIYYWRKFVFQGNLNFNNVRPGNHKSKSVSGAVQYGQEGHYWIGLTMGGGREAWQTLTLTPQDVQFTSYSTSVFLRKWFTPRHGMAFSYNYAVKRAAYRINGVDVRFFVDF
ncbi:MAG: YaiO family outer membrane beta-barrel protein [Acidobacteria bacterium]|nr:YaiO family outer membrane beta-barrel protein [Acidobacteriota bacterium]